MRMTDLQQQQSMPRRAVLLAVTAVVCFGLVAAGAVFLLMREPEKLAEVASASSPSAGAQPQKPTGPAANDPNGAEACRLVRSATSADMLMDAATVSAIEAAAMKSTDTGIYISGAMLKDRQELALAAKGRSTEFEYTLKVLETASNMATTCAKGGYLG